MSELKPCPFKHADGDVVLTIFDRYGSHIGAYKKGEKLFDGERLRVVCGICDALGPVAYKANEAKKLWNQR